MDVKTLCLGVLTEGDKTGYEIKQRFEEAFSHFFGAGFGSIYPALADLSRRGLVTRRSVEQDKRPDKKIYSLTAAGQRVLIDELLATPPRHKVRSEFLVLMYFAHLLPPERVAAIVDQMIARWEPLVAELETCVAASGTPACALPPAMAAPSSAPRWPMCAGRRQSCCARSPRSASARRQSWRSRATERCGSRPPT